jgi:hypothetical protein
LEVIGAFVIVCGILIASNLFARAGHLLRPSLCGFLAHVDFMRGCEVPPDMCRP